MYAARSIPFGVVAGLLPLFTTGPAVIAVVVLAAHIQLFDIIIALRRRGSQHGTRCFDRHCRSLGGRALFRSAPLTGHRVAGDRTWRGPLGRAGTL